MGSDSLNQDLANALGVAKRSKYISARAYIRKILPLLDQMGCEPSLFRYYGIVREPVDWLWSWFRFKLSDLCGDQSTEGLEFSSFLEGYLIEDSASRSAYGNLVGRLRS